MARYRKTDNRDDTPEAVLDGAFAGVDMRDPPAVGPGLVCEAVNKDFSLGTAAPRKGFVSMPWACAWGIDFPIAAFPFDFEQRGFGTIYGTGLFSDPNGYEGGLVANKYGVWRLRNNAEPECIFLPDHEQITGDVWPIQCFDRVLLLRGADLAPLVWNPEQQFADGIGEFAEIEQTAVRDGDEDNTYGDGTDTIPNAEHGLAINGRVILVVGRDELVISDLYDYTRYSPATARLRVNQGSDDSIVALAPWNNNTVIVFKTQSVESLTGLYGDLSEASAPTITGMCGLVGRRAWATAGKDIWFLSEHGVQSVAATLENELQAVAEPVSRDIQKLIDRINWGAASGAAAANFGHKFFLAVPLDGASYNNALLVFDFVTGKWAGHWEAEFLDVHSFVKMDYAGRKRLFVLQGDATTVTRARGAALLVEEGFYDIVSGKEYEIEDEVVTRGYNVGGLEDKRHSRLILDLATSRPKIAVSTLSDGAKEETTEGVKSTRDRTKYDVWGKADYDETNANDDFFEPYRQDYSIALPADGLFLGTNGVDPDLLQRGQEPVRVRQKGEFLQVRIKNTQGRCELKGVQVEARRGRSNFGRR